MSRVRFLHIGRQDKFLTPLFSLLQKHGLLADHVLLTLGKQNTWPEEIQENARVRRPIGWAWSYFRQGLAAEKIYIHGLVKPHVVLAAFLQPWLLPKSHWLIWGSDLYISRLSEPHWKLTILEFFKRPVIRNIGSLVTYVEGDFELARDWYSAMGKMKYCFLYPSNLCRPLKDQKQVTERSSETKILLGNSADPSNEHFSALKTLSRFKEQKINVIVPLSYGDENYAGKVMEEGSRLLGECFYPLQDFLPIQDYLRMLAEVDIAIFSHKRQQAMGNIINLIGLGKKVYIQRETTTWDTLKELGLIVFDVAEFSLAPITKAEKEQNQKRALAVFSQEKLVSQWKALTESV